jgi:formyltetrahydrofolate deformylase
VAALAQTLYRHGANILSADQYTDLTAGQFFQRIQFDLADASFEAPTIEAALTDVARELGMSLRLEYARRLKNVAVFVSRYDHCLHDLLWRHRVGELPCSIRIVVSNHPDLEPVAAQFGIPFRCFAVTPETKAAAEAAQIALIRELGIDLVVFARYMQVVSSAFTNELGGRMINIHHSFLPAFVGQKPYHQAHARGVKLIGATAHYVTGELDEGPIIDQDVVRITHRETVDDLVRKGRDLEKVVLARAVRLHLEDRLLVSGNKTVVFE